MSTCNRLDLETLDICLGIIGRDSTTIICYVNERGELRASYR
jgi:hypothetical protein